MRSAITEFGFDFGPAKVTRMMADDKAGWVYIGVESPKPTQTVNVYVTKTGKTRVYKEGKELK